MELVVVCKSACQLEEMNFFSFSENAPEPALIWVSDNEFFSLIQTDDKIFFSKVSNYLFTGHMFEKKSPNEFALKVGIE